MHTGDLATIDEDGYCRIVGRIKDMIIRGGENIYPREIEEHLRTHPDIVDAQIFGVPDAKFGEEVCAWVISRNAALSEAAVIAHCRGQIAHYKVPRHVRVVESFPLTVSGKAQKFMMRDVMIVELGAAADI
jgi:fatty-acyl-CoA synthase